METFKLYNFIYKALNNDGSQSSNTHSNPMRNPPSGSSRRGGSSHSRTPSVDYRNHSRNSSADLNKHFRPEIGVLNNVGDNGTELGMRN